MFETPLTGLDKKGLRRWLILFFLLLAAPTAILIQQAYSQLKWEAFHQQRILAGELAARIDRLATELIDREEARSFTDYHFLQVEGDASTGFLQRSALSAYPATSGIPGLIGHFQVDTQGLFSTPLLPDPNEKSGTYGIPDNELRDRQMLAGRIQRILSENRLVHTAKGTSPGDTGLSAEPAPREDYSPATRLSMADTDKDLAKNRAAENRETAAPTAKTERAAMPQAAFDRLNEQSALRQKQKLSVAGISLGRVEDLKLDRRFQDPPVDEAAQKTLASQTTVARKRGRKEQELLAEAEFPLAEEQISTEPDVGTASRILTFESELDPFEFSLLDSGHFVLFRKVWRDDQRYIQGALIEQQPFLQGIVESAFAETGLSRMSDLIVAFQGGVVSAFRAQASREYLSYAQQLEGTVLYDRHLSSPLNDLELIFSINRLPAGPGGSLVTWTAIILALVLLGSFSFIYRLGARQIDLTRQKQDFVSAVSHELKTPLTSIRMYGEMLLQGWASEEKKQVYYGYIHDESERLSRLISNVLQLARVDRDELQLDIRDVPVTELVDNARSRLASQVERTGFGLVIDCPEHLMNLKVRVDQDGFTQILINLVDNAIKFSATADNRTVELSCGQSADGGVWFGVRDYGPGVPRDQRKKIFQPFYRSEDELTRETVGTGIGLALVDKLVAAMNGRIEVVDSNPGAEFRITLPGNKVTSD